MNNGTYAFIFWVLGFGFSFKFSVSWPSPSRRAPHLTLELINLISAVLFPVSIPSQCCWSQLVSFSYLLPFCCFLLCGLVLQCPHLSPGAFNYMPMCQWEFRMADAIWLVFKAVTVTKRSFPWGQEVLFQGMCFGEEPKALVCVTVGEFKGKRDGAPAGSRRHHRSMAGLSPLLLLHHATTLARIWHWNP